MMHIEPGTVVGVPFGPFTHVGIATPQGTVISNSMAAGGVCEQSVKEFGGGKTVRHIRHPGRLAPSEVVSRARSLIGVSYDAVQFNCEHFVSWAHGLRPRSGQLVVVLIVLGVACYGLLRKR